MTRPALIADLCVGVVLRDARRRLQLPLAAVAAAVGVNGNLIGIWERGGERIPLARRPRLAAVLGLDPDTLLPPDIVAVTRDEARLLAAYRAMDDERRINLSSAAVAMAEGSDTA